MNATVIRLISVTALVTYSVFAQVVAGTPLVTRVMTVLGHTSNAEFGTAAFDLDLTQHLRRLGARKEIFDYIVSRAEKNDLIVRAEFFADTGQIWFGAFENGQRVECDVTLRFDDHAKLKESLTQISRAIATVAPEAVRPHITRLDLSKTSSKR